MWNPVYSLFLINSAIEYKTLILYFCQTCTEMVMPMCTDGVQDMFEPVAWNFQAFSDECYALFGVRPREDWAETVYGGKNISSHSNIIFR